MKADKVSNKRYLKVLQKAQDSALRALNDFSMIGFLLGKRLKRK